MAPRRHHRSGRRRVVKEQKEAISLYFHVPFCTKKCDYCHFYVIPNKEIYHEQLLEGFALDLTRWKPQLVGKRLVSIYFGGGTPSLLKSDELASILKQVQRVIPFDPTKLEITLEANPETITQETMKQFAAVGINRVSIGVQTLDDPLLIKLGRSHRASASIEAVEATAAAGINNISIDLMYDIPAQTLASWRHTLEQIGHLPITHLSLYNLTIEPHTVFFKYRETIAKEVPDADISAQMYKTAVDILAKHGLIQYEISAFAHAGHQSQHNTGYWTGRPFLGFGPSAFSDWQGKRFRAIANLQKYLQNLREGNSPIDFSEQLPAEQRRRELLVIALRLCIGVDLGSFTAKNGPLDELTIKALQNLQQETLVERRGDIIKLSPRGILFYDTVAAELI